MMEEEDEKTKENLHINLLADLTKHYCTEMETYATFEQRLKKYLPPVTIKASKHFGDVLDALVRTGDLAIGKYDALLKLFEGIDASVVTLIKNCAHAMQVLEKEGNESNVRFVDIWKDISAWIKVQFKTNKITTTNALQRYTVNEFKNVLIYPEVHAVLENSVNKSAMVLRAASPVFYSACCKKDNIKFILTKVLDNPIQQIRMFQWLDTEIAIEVEIRYKKEHLTTHTEKVDAFILNDFCDCHRWLKDELTFNDINNFLTEYGVIDEETLKTVNGIDDLIEFLLNNPEKQPNFKTMLNETGHHGIVDILDGTNVNELISGKAYKVYTSILNNYNSIRKLNVQVLEDCSSQLKQIINVLPSKEMNLLLKEILGNVNVLHAFIMALNNASHECRYEEVLDTLRHECRLPEDKDLSHGLHENIQEGVLQNLFFKVPVSREGIPATSASQTLEHHLEMRIRRNYSSLLKVSITSIRNELVHEGIISPLTKYLIESENKNNIKTDMVLKSLLRSKSEKLEIFQNLLRRGNKSLKNMAIILENDTKKCSEETECQTGRIDGLKASLEKMLDLTNYPMEKLEMNFLHPFFEEEIISIDEHNQVFYGAVKRRHEYMRQLILSKVDHACKKQTWVTKYDELVKFSSENASNIDTDENIRYGVQIIDIIKSQEVQSTTEPSGGEIVVTFNGEQSRERSMVEANRNTNTLHNSAAVKHGVIEDVSLKSIKVLLKTPSPLFYQRIKSACESGDIQAFLQSIIQTFIKEEFQSSTITAQVEIKISHVEKDWNEKVEQRKTTDTISTHKLRDCRHILINEVFLSDIEHSLLNCSVIDHGTLKRIKHSKTENKQKMEEFLNYMEDKPAHDFQNFIRAMRSSGYQGISQILKGSYAKHLNSIPEFKVRMCILDNYETLTNEIHLEELKAISTQLRDDIERVQRQSQNKKDAALHLFFKEILLDNTTLLKAFIDSLSNHIKYHHILKQLEETSCLYEDFEAEKKHDSMFTYIAMIQISKTDNLQMLETTDQDICEDEKLNEQKELFKGKMLMLETTDTDKDEKLRDQEEVVISTSTTATSVAVQTTDSSLSITQEETNNLLLTAVTTAMSTPSTSLSLQTAATGTVHSTTASFSAQTVTTSSSTATTSLSVQPAIKVALPITTSISVQSAATAALSIPSNSRSVQSATTCTVSIPTTSLSVQSAATCALFTPTTSPSVTSAVLGTVSIPTTSLSVQSCATDTVSTTATSLAVQSAVTSAMSTPSTSLSLQAATGTVHSTTASFSAQTVTTNTATIFSNVGITLEETNYLRLTALVLKIGRVNSRNFDIMLMIVLLKEICGIYSPPNGWNRLPHVQDYSEGSEIARISAYRNQIIHGSKFSINNYDFNNIWLNLKQTLLRVGGKGFTAEIDALLVCPLDQSYDELYRELRHLKTEPVFPQRIQAYQNGKLERWMNEERAYVPTRATQAAIGMLDSKDILVLSGPPGCGKSATVHHIALQMRNKGHSIYPVKTIKDIVDNWIPGLDQVFVLDDPFGVYDVNIAVLNDWEMHKDVLDVFFKHSYLKILMTTRLHITKDKQMKKILEPSNIGTINLVDESLILSSVDRISIFQRYAILYERYDLLQIDSEMIQEFNISCFPLVCRIYAADKTSNHSVESFFKRPMAIINEEIKKLQNIDPIRYVCLLLCMIYDNNLNVTMLEVSDECNKERIKREDFLEMCRLSRSLSRVEIESKMNTLLNTFLVKEGNTVRFVHDLIQDSVMKHVNDLSSEMHKVILKHCSSIFVRDRIRLMVLPSKDADVCINLRKDLEPTWGCRLFRDIRDGYWLDVFNNVCLQSEYGDKILAEELTRHKQTDLQALMCSVKLELMEFLIHLHQDLLNADNDDKEWAFDAIQYFLVAPCTSFHFALSAGLKNVITKTLKLITKSEVRKLNSIIDALSLACFTNQTEMVKLLIDNGADVNYIDPRVGSPLYIALRSGGIEIAHILVNRGANVNTCNRSGESPLYIASDVNKGENNGRTPLYISAQQGCEPIVQLLMDNGADANKCDNGGKSPLYIASKEGHDTVVQLLIDNGADVNKCANNGDTPLCIASYHGHDTVVQLLIDNRADVNMCDNDGKSPLYIASYRGHEGVVQLLIDNGADVNMCDNDGKSTLYIVSYRGHEGVVQLLIHNGADVNMCDNDGKSPLYIASYNGHDKVVQLLIDNGADVNKCDDDGESPLYIGSYQGHDKVEQLLINNGADENKCDNDDQSPLYIASDQGHDKVVQLLLDTGADVNKCDSDDQSPLYIASNGGHDTVVQLLIDNGADVNKCDNYGQSSLYIASNGGHDTVVQLLIDNGADVNTCDNDGQSPLHIASYQGHDTVVQLLIDNGADVNTCDIYGKSALYTASEERHDTVIQLLIDNGADVNKCDTDGESPLYIESYQGQDKVVQLLLDTGADVNKCDIGGKSPLHITSNRGYDTIIQLLINCGADVNKCDIGDKSPLYLASNGGHDTVVQLLIDNGADVNKCDIYGKSVLYTASDEGHDAVLQLLMDNGADVNKCDDGGKSPLYSASNRGHETVVQLLIDNGADVNKCDNYGQSPLYIASNRGYDTVVQLLIDNGADVNKCDIYGKSVLYTASEEGHDTVVRLLMDNGADVNKCDDSGKSPLYIASNRGYGTVVQLLIDNGADINGCDNDGESPLYTASENGRDKVVQLLLYKGADANIYKNNGHLPLAIGSYMGHNTVVQLLLDHGTNVNICDNDGASLLFLASKEGNDTLVQLLQANGANVNKCDNDNKSPLYVASYEGHKRVVQLLIDNGASVNTCDTDGKSPLYVASSFGHDTIAQLLIDSGGDVSRCDNDGKSPLYISSYWELGTLSKLLIDNGANVDKCDNDGKSPLYVASCCGYERVVQLLIDNGADVNKCDVDGKSPLYISSYRGHVEVAQLLIDKGADVNKCVTDSKSQLDIASPA